VLLEARQVTKELGVPLAVNDRVDLALLVEADLVHVGQDDLPAAEVRRLGLPVGLSTHARSEIDTADADYIGVGPVFTTPTKPGRPAVGLELVRYAAAHAPVPWFAIGAIDRSNVDAVVAAGATRIAVVRAIGDAADPERAARELREVLDRAPLLASP
jgi:thiamine-phosphate pyrophosphorylase